MPSRNGVRDDKGGGHDKKNSRHRCRESVVLRRRYEKGVYEKTSVAKKYEERFAEIAIDEYQDSNEVQESILNAISRGNNIFMVGDVKQSIYKFRQARPELFLEKYATYKLKGEMP